MNLLAINLWIGNLGHLLVITAFVTALVSTLAYYWATQAQNTGDTTLSLSWQRFARTAFGIHALAVVGVVIALFDIVYNHRYEYHYAWDHSSNHLPTQYMIACFWEGQEGSFLLWMFWHILLGAILIYTARHWENAVMSIFAGVQMFLASMLLGVVIFGAKVGSDPFILLRDAMPHLPVFKDNPSFVPSDGSGLNALLQNYWMVIHPPTLFLGFAFTLVPFAYTMAGLWLRQYTTWLKPALPWALAGAAVLGVGIMMGAYWAYETLNFGGYWNWDPVENAVYIPWVVMVAGIHTMIAYQAGKSGLKSAIILNISTFILILYSTFLTRSGILGNASVHSFTDLGLSGQLLLYLLAFLIAAIVLSVLRWRDVPKSARELKVYHRDFWIFMGALVLVLAGFQVFLTTSIPVYNKIAEVIGWKLNMALPADQVTHYTRFQLWGGVLVAALSATGQLVWWNKVEWKQWKWLETFALPLALALLLSTIAMTLGGIGYFPFIILLTTSLYSITANGQILLQLTLKRKAHISGGAVAHLGVAMMLLGILFSSGYSKVVSKNTSGLLYSQEFSAEMNENNVLLWLNQPVKMGDYQISYRGDYVESPKYPHYIKKTALAATEDPYKGIALENIAYNGKQYFKTGDSVEIYPENTFYRVDYRNAAGQIFSLYPRAQVNEQMGGLLASPDIFKSWRSDLYTHVSSIPDPTQEKKWSETQEFKAKLGDTLFLNDYVAIFEAREPLTAFEMQQLNGNKETAANDVGVRAVMRVMGKEANYTLRPIFVIKNQQVGMMPDVLPELGLRVGIASINPKEETFTFAVSTTQKDYIIMKAMEKPLINLLWIGTLILTLGLVMATVRRYREANGTPAAPAAQEKPALKPLTKHQA